MDPLPRDPVAPEPAAEGGKLLRPLAFQRSDAALVEAVRAGRPEARALLFDRYGSHVQAVMVRLLGRSDELSDTVHDVFVEVLGSIDKLEDPERLKAWITRVAVFVARHRIRYAKRRRWLRFVDRVPEPPPLEGQQEARSALRAAYLILDDMKAEDRIAFALRYLEGMDLTEVADVCDTSLSTVKRRLKRAENRFVRRASDHPVLATWLEEGSRWTTKAH